jgi:hypothetical protein
LALANIVREEKMMAQTGRELRRQMIYVAAADYQKWNNERRFWRRVSITCAVVSVFLAGVAVGGAIS